MVISVDGCFEIAEGSGYRGSGWAYAALVQNKIVRVRYISPTLEYSFSEKKSERDHTSLTRVNIDHMLENKKSILLELRLEGFTTIIHGVCDNNRFTPLI